MSFPKLSQYPGRTDTTTEVGFNWDYPVKNLQDWFDWNDLDDCVEESKEQTSSSVDLGSNHRWSDTFPSL